MVLDRDKGFRRCRIHRRDDQIRKVGYDQFDESLLSAKLAIVTESQAISEDSVIDKCLADQPWMKALQDRHEEAHKLVHSET